MSGLLTRMKGLHLGYTYAEDSAIRRLMNDVLGLAPNVIRAAVEAHQNLALDSKADREALIRDLVEALC